jgi:hypothetical protein
MELIELLKRDTFRTVGLAYEGDFIVYLRDKLEAYLSDLEDLNDEVLSNIPGIKTEKDSVIRNQKNLVDGLLKSVEYYMDGSPSQAFQTLKKALDSRVKKWNHLFNVEEVSPNNDFYRIRYNDTNIMQSKDRYFHVPFEMRHLINTQRYSIHGFPSLYLGSSIYICWEELGRPNVNNFHVVRLQNKEALNVLDLSTPNLDHPTTLKDIYRYMVVWPLILTCSIPVRKQDAIFKQEYIMPQLLLQWVRQNGKIDGIKYWSTIVNQDPRSTKGSMYNYVFPVKETKVHKGICPILRKKFLSTEATSIQMQTIANGNQEYNHFRVENEPYDNKFEQLEIAPGRTAKYSQTIFGSLERALNYMELHEI